MITLLSYCIQLFQGWFQGQLQITKARGVRVWPSGKGVLIIGWVFRPLWPRPCSKCSNVRTFRKEHWRASTLLYARSRWAHPLRLMVPVTMHRLLWTGMGYPCRIPRFSSVCLNPGEVQKCSSCRTHERHEGFNWMKEWRKSYIHLLSTLQRARPCTGHGTIGVSTGPCPPGTCGELPWGQRF